MTRKAIQEFWVWFQGSAPRLARLYEAKNLERLSKEMNRRLDAISEELPWEIGPGRERRYSLTFSPEGNHRLFVLVQRVLRHAPDLPSWELHSSRQPRPPLRVVKLPERGLSFRTERWRFVPETDARIRRIHLTILDTGLASAERDASLKAVSIFLDQFLGENTVEDWLGTIAVARPSAKLRSYPISDLPNYVASLSRKGAKPD